MAAQTKTTKKTGFGAWQLLIVVLVVLAIAAIYGNYLGNIGNYNPNWNITTSSYGTPTTTLPQNTSIAVYVPQELNNSANFGFSVNAGMLRTPYASNCTRELIDSCDNNAPSQFICVNNAYASNIQNQYQSIYSNHSHICPQYILEGTIGCTSYAGYCVVTRQT